jgi:hypothetical protein
VRCVSTQVSLEELCLQWNLVPGSVGSDGIGMLRLFVPSLNGLPAGQALVHDHGSGVRSIVAQHPPYRRPPSSG